MGKIATLYDKHQEEASLLIDVRRFRDSINKMQGASSGWTAFTNLSTDKTCDADSTTVAELADILGTLIEALKDAGIITE